MKTWKKKCKGKGIKVLLALGEGNLAKKKGRKRQKFVSEPWPSRMEREKAKNFLKKCLSDLKLNFFKNIPYDFRLIEKQFRMIKTHRGSQKFLKTISIDWKTYSINRNRQRLTKFWEKHSFWKSFRNNSKHRNKGITMHEYVIIWFSKTRIEA